MVLLFRFKALEWDLKNCWELPGQIPLIWQSRCVALWERSECFKMPMGRLADKERVLLCIDGSAVVLSLVAGCGYSVLVR